MSESVTPDYLAQYQDAYARLNPEQQRAVDTIEGPVMVLAGPGTGKTQMLSVRMAHILQATQAEPHNLLALTFTQAGAKTMQQRLVQLIGPTGYGVKCSTFHGFCTEIIQENPGLFAISPQSQAGLSEVDKLTVVENIILQGDYTEIKTVKNPRSHIRDVYHLISNYKREGHTPSSLRELWHAAEASLVAASLTAAARRQQEKVLRQNKEVIEVYTAYQNELAAAQQFDFDDMILWVRDALENDADLLANYQEKYQYVMVDEFQDTNQAQLAVVRRLLSYDEERPNLCVVGDPNQSIYRFQGASLANTLGFLDLYPAATVVTLRTGYRCGRSLYQAAATLMQQATTTYPNAELQAALTQPLQSARATMDSQLIKYESATTLGECSWIAQQIQNQHQVGIPYQDMAVLYRKHSHGALLLDILQRLQIPVQVEDVHSVLDEPVVQQILLLLRCVVSLNQNEEIFSWLPVLQLPWLNLDPTDVLQLARSTFRAKTVLAWDYLNDDKRLADLKLKNLTAIINWRQQLLEWQAASTNTPAPQLVETILRTSGFYRYIWEQPGAWSTMSAVMALLRSAQSWQQTHAGMSLADWLERLSRMAEHGVKMAAADVVMTTDAVFLGSAHQSKGREWSQVFLLHVNDGKWGNVRSPSSIAPLPGTIPYAELDKPERNADERRLLYVAMTRARDKLTVSYSHSEIDNDQRKELIPSQFLVELESENWQTIAPMSSADLQAMVQTYVQAAPTPSWLAQVDTDWLRAALDRFALSASALNSYLNCPRQFFFQYVLKMPQPVAPALAIGSAVHAALEQIYKRFGEVKSLPDLADIWPIMEKVVEKIQPNADLASSWSAAAKSIISAYYQAEHTNWHPCLFQERWFGTTTPVVVEGLRLLGKIDRIDLLNDAARTVRVVDYKTGRTRSRNDILGLTQNSDGGYWRQLVFYKLLADQSTDFSYHVTEGELVFVEPTTAGKYKSECFPILDEHVARLHSELQQVAAELQSLDFLHKPGCGQCDICRATGAQSAILDNTLQAEQLDLFHSAA